MAARHESWSLKKPNLLIVEGYSDLRFIAEFLQHLGNHQTTDIFIVEGRSKFEPRLPELLLPPTLAIAQHIGIVIDADTSAAGSFRKIANIVKKCVGVEVPGPGHWEGTRPRFGIFVCPDGNRVGELETAAWEAWAADPKNSGQLSCIERYVDCVAATDAKLKISDKVRVGAMLAVHNDDDPRVGPGAQKRIFDFDSVALAPMKAFLTPLATKSPEAAP